MYALDDGDVWQPTDVNFQVLESMAAREHTFVPKAGVTEMHCGRGALDFAVVASLSAHTNRHRFQIPTIGECFRYIDITLGL